MQVGRRAGVLHLGQVFCVKKGRNKAEKGLEKSRNFFFLENAKKSLTNLLGCGKMFRLSVATDAKHSLT